MSADPAFCAASETEQQRAGGRNDTCWIAWIFFYRSKNRHGCPLPHAVIKKLPLRCEGGATIPSFLFYPKDHFYSCLKLNNTKLNPLAPLFEPCFFLSALFWVMSGNILEELEKIFTSLEHLPLSNFDQMLPPLYSRPGFCSKAHCHHNHPFVHVKGHFLLIIIIKFILRLESTSPSSASCQWSCSGS